jgi:DNA transformation protein and related proteins
VSEQLRELKGLGPQSEKLLKQIGITSPQLLRDPGPIRAYIRLIQTGAIRPNLNFLYALVGAVEDKNWLKIARQEKGRLLMELEGYAELQKMLSTQEHTADE